MNKIGMILAGFIALSSLTACTLVEKVIGERSNGVVVYGDRSEVEKVQTQFKDELEFTSSIEVLVSETVDEKLMIMNETSTK